jgi:hypothetical protein
MVSNLLKRLWVYFASVERQRDGFGAFQKKWDAILPHPTPPQALTIHQLIATF